MRLRIFRVGLLAFAFLAPCALQAQQMTTTVVTFNVTDSTGAAIAHAQIIVGIRSATGALKTDEHGRLTVNLPTGADFHMPVSAPGYKSAAVHIDLTSAGGPASATKNVSVVLQPDDSALQAPANPTDSRAESLSAVENPEEYAVWSAVLTYACPAGASRQIVIEDRTSAFPESPIPPNGAQPQSHYSAGEAVADVSRQPYTLEKKFTLKLPYVLVSTEETPKVSWALPGSKASREDAAELKPGWDHFYTMYPGACGILQFSRVAFLNHGTLAAVFGLHRRAATDFLEGLYLLGRKNGSWEVERVEPEMGDACDSQAGRCTGRRLLCVPRQEASLSS